MNKDIKKIFDKEQKKERIDTLFGFFLAFVTLMALGFLYFPLTNDVVYGVTVAPTVVHGEDGSYPRVKVKLHSGANVVASISKKLRYKSKAKVKMNKRKRLFGMTTYHIYEYENKKNITK